MGRMPRNSVPYTAYERDLLREAAEFLSRERRLYEERVREELLRREWYRPCRREGTSELHEDR